ncbi:MAG: methyl-accepting chemotaxis protein [Elusimicrobia bacterium]|nr:methyl-accepting chemotaxis protein [Elusimicrobiota bacterium]
MRRRYYVDSELQFPIILALLLLVTLEGVFVGWGFSKAAALARDWRRLDQVAAFFKAFLLTVVPLVAGNFLIGTWLSHKIAGPLVRMRRAMAEIARGNLEVDISERKGDLLHAYVRETGRMAETLRRLIYRDHAHAAEADALLTKCRQRLSENAGLGEDERRELNALLDEAKSRLGIINTHFLKGRRTSGGEEP